MDLLTYIKDHTARGGCVCGNCDYDAIPDGVIIDLTFFKVGICGKPNAETLINLIKNYDGPANIDLFDGFRHSYFDIAEWLGGNRELSLLLIGMGAILGIWEAGSPSIYEPDLPAPLKLCIAMNGLVTMKCTSLTTPSIN